MNLIFQRIFLRLLEEAGEPSGEELSAKIPARIEKARQAGLALYRTDENIFILYDPRPIVQAFAEFNWTRMRERSKAINIMTVLLEESAPQSCIAMIGITPPGLSDSGPCNGAAEVSLAAARQGFGPMMYDIAMTYANKFGSNEIMPDRKSVSSDAEKVWKGMSIRSDVEAHPFVDFKDPVNKDNSSACRLHPPNRKSLNASYVKRSTLDPAALFLRHEEIINTLLSLLPKNLSLGKEVKLKVQESLYLAAEELFQTEHRSNFSNL